MRNDSTPSIVECVCQVCSKVFHLERSRVWNGRGKTCSKACAAELKRGGPLPCCSNCGVTLQRRTTKTGLCKPCMIRERARQHWASKEQVKCPVCSTMFYPSMKNRTYCSWECARQRFGGQPPIPNPDGYCLCGCGKKTKIATQTQRERGYVAGYPVPYCQGHSHRINIDEAYVIEDRGYKTPCWVWQEWLCCWGYAHVGGKRAHRVMYERERGAIPPGMDLHHECHVRECINPDHLTPLTRSDHMRLHKSKHPH